MVYSRIMATGSYLPEKVLTNADLESMVDTQDEWIMQRVGISQRRILSKDETTSSMAIAAAQSAMDASKLDPQAIDLIIVASVTSENVLPSIACIVQNALGITNECPAFDVSAACSGFIYAMSIADQYIRSGEAKHALIVGVEALSKITDWTDRETCVLFGDGAGAAVLAADDKPGIIATKISAAGKYGDKLFAQGRRWCDEASSYIQMSGKDVFKVATKKLDEIVEQVLEKGRMTKEELDWLIPHQANARIIEATAKRLQMPMSKVILTIAHHGNTSSASVPLAFDEAVRGGKIQRGDRCILEAFGGGVAWGAALVIF